MKKLLVIILISVSTHSTAQESDSAYIRNNYTKTETYIPMRDGKKLFTAIYAPNDKSLNYPFLLTRTPFSVHPYGENKYPTRLGPSMLFVREGYIFVYQDVRGKWMSEGEFEDVRPHIKHKISENETDESTDAFDTIDWLVKNIMGNNGKVGVVGTSYNGFYATQAALSDHPAVVAVSPQAPVTDWFMGDDFHRNGAFALIDAFRFFNSGFGTARRAPTTVRAGSAYKLPAIDAYQFFLRTGALPNFTKLTGDTIAFWNQMMKHPNYDAWWKARNVRNSLYNVKPSMLTVGGLNDAEDLFGPLNTFKAIEKQSPSTSNRLVLGPWAHGQWTNDNASSLGNIQFGSNTSDWFSEHIEAPFFNYYLKGKGSVEDINKATVFFSGTNTWKSFNAWPPRPTGSKPLFFQPGGKLSWQKPSANIAYSSYTSDPSKPVPYIEGRYPYRNREYMNADQRFASGRPDVLVFETPVLENEITLAGPLIANLLVNISTTDADFVVKLIDVFPDDFKYEKDNGYVMGGYEMLVRGDVLRGRYRNSFEKPESFTPGKIDTVKFALPDVAHTFKKGHRIMVHIQSSWFPLIDRNPQRFVNIYEARDSQFQKATIRIYHDRKNSSSIILPVINM